LWDSFYSPWNAGISQDVIIYQKGDVLQRDTPPEFSLPTLSEEMKEAYFISAVN